ncbi:hypothetical protein GHT07_13600 [Caenimonas koreensis DSM 17982]|uniref:DUF6916 domain-containing protein n=1 Tax=Caenimonas koreensis DSM 17982 TaxID=1121255 RepID=A0A844B9N8_9BURK|nr:hypothetical protein [Caenimonas koreensis]MRD48319.1 hypothetical protein [Caenimonas koreensis DSM 17982]
MTVELKRQDFMADAVAGLAFELPDGGRLALAVAELRDLPPISSRKEPFAVVLQGPANPAYAQGIVPLLHPVHGRCDVFAVPIARDAQKTLYELIFN